MFSLPWLFLEAENPTKKQYIIYICEIWPVQNNCETDISECDNGGAPKKCINAVKRAQKYRNQPLTSI